MTPASRRTTRLAGLRPEFGLLAASLIVCFLLAEAILRLHYLLTGSGTLADLDVEIPAPGTDVTLGEIITVSEFPRLVYQLKPGLVDVRWKGASISTSSQGFRDSVRPPPGDRPLFRIVGIGDSVMFGLGVEEQERYMDVLESQLRQKFPAVAWETVTLAAPGYNLVMELEALKRFGLAFEPNLLIYGFIPNDFCLPNFVSRRVSVRSFESFLQLYWNRTGAGGLLVPRQAAAIELPDPGEERLSRRRDLLNPTFCSPDNTLPRYRDLVGRQPFIAALDELAEIGREHGAATAFLSYAWRRPRFSLPEGMVFISFHTLYQKYLKENGYSALVKSDLVLSESDQHPSPRGHQLIGIALAARLAELGLLASH